MKLSEIDENYSYFSGRLSALTRQLALAGIAFVWVFSGPQSATGVMVPEDLTRVALFLVGVLSCEFLQYSWATAAWGVLRRARETEHSTDLEGDVGDAPDWINWPTLVLFWGKVVFVVVAYILLGLAILRLL